MRTVHIEVNRRNGHKKRKSEVEEQPEIGCQQKAVGKIVKVRFGFGYLFSPVVENFDEENPFGHTHEITDVMYKRLCRNEVQMMPPVEQHIEKAQEKQGKSPFVKPCIRLFADALHHKKRRAIDQHIVRPDNASGGFPLDDHIFYKDFPEIRNDPKVIFDKNKQEIHDARDPHPDINRQPFECSYFLEENN